MRQIKFRAQDYTGTWHYGYIVQDTIVPVNPDGSAELGINIYVKPETIGQFTGLYDKNGNEVFEGDILLFKDLKPLWDDQTVVVGWSEFGARFETGGFNIRLCTVNEIIGNVFDNKELLNNG